MRAEAAPSEPRGRARQRLETRERLFEAALDELRRSGLAGAQIDRITAAVGVSRGAFYFHFATKEDVLLEWERRQESEISARLDRPRGAPRTLRGALLEIVRSLAELAGSPDLRLVRDVLSIHVREASDPESYLLLAEIEQRLAVALGRGELRRDVDARQGAILFLSNVFGFLVTRSTTKAPHPRPEQLVDVFLSGVTVPKLGALRRKVAGRRGGPR